MIADQGDYAVDESGKRIDKSSWAIGGSLLVGIGVGFLFLQENPLAFVAFLLVGLGVGLVLAAILSR